MLNAIDKEFLFFYSNLLISVIYWEKREKIIKTFTMCNNKFFCFNRLFYFIIFKPNCSKLFTKVYFCFVLTSYFLWVICYEKKNIWTSIDFEVINFPFTRRDTNKQQLEIIALSFYTRIISGNKWRINFVEILHLT